MNSKRIDKAIEVINYAIVNQLSVKAASKKCGFGDTYVKNVKAVVFDLYSNGALSEELFLKFNNAYKLYEETKELDLPKIEVSSDKPTDLPSHTGQKTKFSVDEDGKGATLDWVSGSNYPENHIKTLEELLEATKVDLNVWKVKETTVNKWDVTMVPKELGYPVTIQNYQVKARLEKNIQEIKEKCLGEIFQEMVKNYQPPVSTISPFDLAINVKEKNLLEISLYDLHFGKLCWKNETGENFDIKIASKRFIDALETLLRRASAFNYERILFPVGNDFFNSDTIFNTTTKGTLQDEDVRWKKSFSMGTKLLVDGINLLKQAGVPVDVIVIPGNHDYEKSYYMGAFLEAWFNDDSIVNINNGASTRKYYRYGKLLLGFTHGGEEKESSLPLLMATDIESKPYWSDTVFHEWHLGHFHRKKNINFSVSDNKSVMLNDELGVTVRYLSSLTGTDFWHHKSGFVGAIKAADAFVWNNETGLIANLVANLVV